MRCILLALLAGLSGGCSTAPVADFLDWVAPGKARPIDDIPIRGGVGTTGLPPDPLQGLDGKRTLPPLPSATRENSIEILDPTPRTLPSTPQSKTAPSPKTAPPPMPPLPPVPDAVPTGYRGESSATRVLPGRVAELEPPESRPSASSER